MSRTAASVLVVVDDGTPGEVGEVGEGAQIVVRESGPSVEDDQGECAVERSIGPGEADPCASRGEGD